MNIKPSTAKRSHYSPGEVETWFMTPEQLAAYVDKHPIISARDAVGQNYKDFRQQTRQRHEAAREKSIQS